MKLLCLGPQNVVPPVDGGKESIHGALSSLAKHAYLVYVYPGTMEEDIRASYRKINVNAVGIPYEPRDTAAGVVLATLGSYPFKFAKYSTQGFVRQVDAALGTEDDFDAIVCFHAHMFRLAQRLKHRRNWHIPVILREHNLEYALVESYVDSLPKLAQIPGRYLAYLTRRAEHAAWREADAVAFITDADLRVAQASGVSGHFFHAPEGTPALPQLPPVELRADNLIVLLNPKATQSVYNVKQFLKETWFAVAGTEAMSSMNLLITGVNTEQAVAVLGIPAEKMAACRVKPLGFVPSLAEVLSSSLAMVSPSYVGGGIRKKILEAMAHGVPVIASELDVDSCGYFADSKNILAFDDNAGFVRAVAALKIPAKRALIVEQAFGLIRDHANWDRFAYVFVGELKKFLPRTQGQNKDGFKSLHAAPKI
jgi:glycosyltransferase involved in cell wall biosynthesis